MQTASPVRRRTPAPQRWELEWSDAPPRRRLAPLLPPALLAAAAATALGWTPGFSPADTKAAVVAAAVAALAGVALVPLAGSGDRLLFVAALASAGAAAIHFSVIKVHFEEYTLYGVFFVGSAVAQLVWPIWLLRRRWPPLLVLGAVGNAAIVALWIADRVGWVPLGPDATKPPPFGFGDSVTSGLEVVLVVACIAALAGRRGRPLRWSANLAFTLAAAALTALAFLSVLGVGSSILPPAK